MLCCFDSNQIKSTKMSPTLSLLTKGHHGICYDVIADYYIHSQGAKISLIDKCTPKYVDALTDW